MTKPDSIRTYWSKAYMQWHKDLRFGTVIKHDPHLREKYNRIRAKGTNGNKAIVAVARSLAVRLRRCLLDGVDYQTTVA